jgi:hypothetical protein
LISNRNCLRPKLMSQKVMTPINKYSLLNLYLIIASLISCFAVDSSFCSLRNRPRSERARPRETARVLARLNAWLKNVFWAKSSVKSGQCKWHKCSLLSRSKIR